MAKRAGLSISEYPVTARELNQAFIGRAFGYNLPNDGGVIYATLAAVAIGPNGVDVWAAGIYSPVEAHHMTVGHDDQLFFEHDQD